MRRADGFTLLEVLVALTVLGVALTVLFGIFGHSLSRARETQARMQAREAAGALLAQAETATDLRYGQSRGHLSSGLDWQLDVRPYGDDRDRRAWPAAAAQLTATVSWGAHDEGQTFRLTTLRLMPKEAQP
jgi:general secretion pathway protein I